MYPKDIELYESTASERKVFKELEKQLPDTYTIFYSIQWVDEINGLKKESESDFLIFSENEGFLTCEVKGGKAYKKIGDKFYLEDRESVRELRRSPMEQAEESSRYFHKLYCNEYNENFNGIYGSISIFPFYEVNDTVLMDHRTKDVVFDILDMNNLYKKIKKAFAFYKNQSYYYGSLTKNQKINFKNMINKKIAAHAAAGAIIEMKEFELNNINRIQDNLVYFLKNYNKTYISGGAGTGKSWIACKFAKISSLEGNETLIVMHSPHLCEFFRTALLNYSNLTILSYRELLTQDGIDCNLQGEKLLDAYESILFKKFNTIIVDEAQDFDQYSAMIISYHLKDEKSELRVFYDLTQNIYNKNFKNGFDIQNPPFELRENLRNTSSIYNWATEQTNLGRDVITNQVIGPMPNSFQFAKMYDLKKYVETEINKLVNRENVPIESIVILTDHDNFNVLNDTYIGSWRCGCKQELRLSLVEDFKGLESNIIFYIHNLFVPENYNYVAYTRAKYYLFNLILKK